MKRYANNCPKVHTPLSRVCEKNEKNGSDGEANTLSQWASLKPSLSKWQAAAVQRRAAKGGGAALRLNKFVAPFGTDCLPSCLPACLPSIPTRLMSSLSALLFLITVS